MKQNERQRPWMLPQIERFDTIANKIDFSKKKVDLKALK